MAQVPRRICLIGPESTGKSQLAARLERECGATWVREYARAYVERRGTLTAADVDPIARGCIANLEAASGDLVVLDTDLISTVVYARYYYGACPPWIEEEARQRRADLYLLLDTDVPWTPDPARDTPGEEREDLFDLFRRTLDEFGVEWRIVSGGWEERWAQVKAAVQ